MSSRRGEGGPGGWPSRRLHFVGIGGAGMSGLALVCRQLGAAVTGSDREDSSYMERLRAAGIQPAVGHDAANVPDGVTLVVSTAIADDNPELAAARERGLDVLHRGELLAELCEEKRLLAIAGTHGKTTTCAMVAWALRELGAEPGFFVGGEVPGLGGGGETVNAGWGDGEWLVAEADESDASFLRLRPEVAVVTNIEMDHHSRWGSLGELQAAFRRFVEPAEGIVLPGSAVAPGRLLAAGNGSHAAAGSAGHGVRGHDGHAAAGALDRGLTSAGGRRTLRFDLSSPGPQELSLAVPGRHNVLNARAALAALELAGFDADAAARALAGFPGAHRRLELKGEVNGARIFDDYGHHPTEVRAALEALREAEPRRLVAVFQPHLFSRTAALAEGFGAALSLADEVIVLDVYPAREEPVGRLAGVSGKLVVDAACDRLEGRPVCWAPTIDQALRIARRKLQPAVTLVTIGAGDVSRLADALVAERGVS